MKKSGTASAGDRQRRGGLVGFVRVSEGGRFAPSHSSALASCRRRSQSNLRAFSSFWGATDGQWTRESFWSGNSSRRLENCGSSPTGMRIARRAI